MIDLALTDNIFINSEFEEALQELDILFNTEYTELINNPSFGVNFEQYLWSLTPTTNELTKYLEEKIGTLYFVNKFNPSVKVEHIQGEYRSIYKLSISLINPDNESVYTKKYQYQ